MPVLTRLPDGTLVALEVPDLLLSAVSDVPDSHAAVASAGKAAKA